jgi:UDP-2-acetamido-2,6-beta-L-arabino-hexul-4-ose reductase
MNILITGANGFVGLNLVVHLTEQGQHTVVPFTREHSPLDLPALLVNVDVVCHLAGVNRPANPDDFVTGNIDLTQALCDAVVATGRRIPIIYSSSIQAENDNMYGNSKRGAEDALLRCAAQHAIPVHIFRLPNVFGKWARPNYNSAVATFCHHIVRDLPIQINDPSANIRLVYIDDVVAQLIAVINGEQSGNPFVVIEPEYQITVGALADQLRTFKNSRTTLTTEPVGTGLVRALYSTYVSYIPPDQFAYDIPKHGDARGVFVEMLKTKDSGQFSFFTAHAGITRGGHYHHSKTEKFLVIKGNACFRFRHVVTGEFYELFTTGDHPQVVETVTGWTHDITNVGQDDMIVMLWANELFDREKPDTYARPVGTA